MSYLQDGVPSGGRRQVPYVDGYLDGALIIGDVSHTASDGGPHVASGGGTPPV